MLEQGACPYLAMVQVYLQQHSSSQEVQNDPRQQWLMSTGKRKTNATQMAPVQVYL
jgi:hypothetical protein